MWIVIDIEEHIDTGYVDIKQTSVVSIYYVIDRDKSKTIENLKGFHFVSI